MAGFLSGLFKKEKNKNVAEAIIYPPDFEDLHKRIYTKVKPYTMTSAERIYGLIEAVKYITRFNIEGAIVECGVWKGGSMMAVAETLNSLNNNSRELYLYDTFAGMPPPTEEDKDFNNVDAESRLHEEEKNKETSVIWAYSALPEVQAAMKLTNYDAARIHYVEGKVEDTIPHIAPEKIALLRLDTDWYESTKHELEHLFSRLSKNGVLIIDDYGFWKGSRKAVDEYFEKLNMPVLLTRMDDTGRICIKQF
ncbi:MAG: TylF/MycF family methyltransferase [Chitinophagaceae bacterium]|nr:TylF/MycF family methyltransferase [Chitinophagaceae bacterium]